MDFDLLFNRARQGDTTARDELFLRLRERFKLFLQHKVWDQTDAEDLLQDVLMTVELKYRELEIEKSFSAWAHKVLVNGINQYYRKKGIEESRFARLDWDMGDTSTSNMVPDLERRLIDCLRKLHRVNRRHARVITLRYQGYTTDEICGRFNCSPDNLYLFLFRARAMLRRCLDTGDVS